MWTLIYLLIAFIACSISALKDARTGEIPNKITYPLIIVGFILSLFPGMFLNIVYGIIFLMISYWFYKRKLFGGGDIKLILGLILLNPTTDIVFICWWLLYACVIAIVFYAYKYYIKKERGKTAETLRFGVPLFISMFIIILQNFLPLILG